MAQPAPPAGNGLNPGPIDHRASVLAGARSVVPFAAGLAVFVLIGANQTDFVMAGGAICHGAFSSNDCFSDYVQHHLLAALAGAVATALATGAQRAYGGPPKPAP